jgi:hypothetical protein
MQSEIWKPVVGWEGGYEVSDCGNVRSLDRVVICSRGIPMRFKGKELKHISNPNGYWYVNLRNGTKYANFTVHRLVAAAFIGPRPEGADILHADHNKQNNHASNLSYGTRAENMAQSLRDNRLVVGQKCPWARLSENDVLAIRNSRQTQRVIAAAYGISQGHVSDIRRGLRWSHVA